MFDAAPASPHTFHIPVMGTGFMIDAPLRVARYGIATVLSLVDDVLIEQMRRYHCRQAGEPYAEIASWDEDARARRITAYLDLLDRLVRRQVEELRSAPFEPGSQITRYFELLPDGPLACEYRAMLTCSDPQDRLARQQRLRTRVVPGRIDVNIMSKGDRDVYRNGQKLPPIYSDASAALRGFARSTLDSAIVFSAGMNPRLYSYAAELADFFPDAEGRVKKQIILKVSDYHSAAVQGRYLAKRGLWVSEFRVESGLNCGGHAFATQGVLLGPILAEFQEKRTALVGQLHAAYAKALGARGLSADDEPRPVRLTVQGGIGTAEEDAMLRAHFGLDGTGWGTPFLLVPEVTNVDEEHLQKLLEATEEDVYLSDSSPFGLPFWNLRTSASEEARRQRIAEDHPGSPCQRGFVRLFNTEFTRLPICTASRQYQELKLKQLREGPWNDVQREALRAGVLAKSCICHDLAGGATRKTGIDPAAAPAVCCGPNIVNFTRLATLEEMVGHIYGRLSLVARPDRPHLLLCELAINLQYFQTELEKVRLGISSSPAPYFQEFRRNLREGILYYRGWAEVLPADARDGFLAGLRRLEQSLDPIPDDGPAASGNGQAHD